MMALMYMELEQYIMNIYNKMEWLSRNARPFFFAFATKTTAIMEDWECINPSEGRTLKGGKIDLGRIRFYYLI